MNTSCYFAVILADNTLKVVRMDNNKIVLTCQKPLFSKSNMTSVESTLVVPDGTRMHFVDLNSEYSLC